MFGAFRFGLLQRLANAYRLRRDVEAYRRQPQTEEELAFTSVEPAAELQDDTDWDALYAGAYEPDTA